MNTILGLDIGGTKIAIVEGTFNAEILQRREIATEAARPFTEKAPELWQEIRKIVAQATVENRQISAISVSIGGPLKISDGFLLNPPHLQGWHNLPLKKILQAQFPDLPVLIEHDGNAGALAEFYFGAGKGIPNLKHLIFLTFGTGLGAGFIVNGQILHGASDTAGEVGHWRLANEGPIGFGKAGSWEGFASGRGLVTLAHTLFPHRWQPDTEIRELVAAMLADDPDALVICEKAGEMMGRGIALLLDALNPQVVVIGTLARVLGERIFAPIRRMVAKEALPQAVAACQIVPAKLGDQIGDVASLMAAIRNNLVSEQ